MSESKLSPSRRSVIQAGVVAASALTGVSIPTVHAGENNTIDVALIGCGGRGSGEEEAAGLARDYERAAEFKMHRIQLDADYHRELTNWQQQNRIDEVVEAEDIAQVVEQWTGIPVQQMLETVNVGVSLTGLISIGTMLVVVFGSVVPGLGGPNLPRSSAKIVRSTIAAGNPIG